MKDKHNNLTFSRELQQPFMSWSLWSLAMDMIKQQLLKSKLPSLRRRQQQLDHSRRR
uniref:Uncharacterized protein n=1 Tax=Megaselia scalaris TaxID=36166 RepID=T1H1W6_MEGSC